MTPFRDIPLAGRFWYGERLLTRMPDIESHPNKWNSFHEDGTMFNLDPNCNIVLEHEGTGDLTDMIEAEEPVDKTSLEFLLGQFVVRRGESKKADDKVNLAAKELYRQLEATGRLWLAAYSAGKKAGMYVNEEKDCNIGFFEDILLHLAHRGSA